MPFPNEDTEALIHCPARTESHRDKLGGEAGIRAWVSPFLVQALGWKNLQTGRLAHSLFWLTFDTTKGSNSVTLLLIGGGGIWGAPCCMLSIFSLRMRPAPCRLTGANRLLWDLRHSPCCLVVAMPTKFNGNWVF